MAQSITYPTSNEICEFSQSQTKWLPRVADLEVNKASTAVISSLITHTKKTWIQSLKSKRVRGCFIDLKTQLVVGNGKGKLSTHVLRCCRQTFEKALSRRDEVRAGLKAMRRGNDNYQLSFAQNTFLQLFHRARHHNHYLRLLRPPCRFLTRYCKKTEKKPFVKELGPAKMNHLR
ncbi:hypothetical protein P5673_015869 [Acropora cervicornis]|uniref:Uncharacterized protein n=1 Tax=Acropora cervicornis TaxID=6130 RepID=A0AAD9V5D5_ACRCE|nr:hypothetical protein P5673_015869 [Acropora cervicornis]